MDTSESAHLFALEPACEEETEEGGERGEEEEEDEDVLDEKEKEAIPRLLDLSLSVSGVRQAAAPPDSSQGTKDEGQTSLHNSKGVHLSTVVKKGLSLFMPNSSTNTSTQGCFRFRGQTRRAVINDDEEGNGFCVKKVYQYMHVVCDSSANASVHCLLVFVEELRIAKQEGSAAGRLQRRHSIKKADTEKGYAVVTPLFRGVDGKFFLDHSLLSEYKLLSLSDFGCLAVMRGGTLLQFDTGVGGGAFRPPSL
mmetsp:Transcript_14794/g.29886  ORF Transcript_14794/g.29886 Transcript_14794/m.29886 type:complete len:252 (+) Transcript_14794:631-1386(+)